MKQMLPSLLLLLLVIPAPGQQVDEFYKTRFVEAQTAYVEKRYNDAATEFRIGCFGFLDDPSLLSSCLAGLYLSQDHLGRANEAETTLKRFLDVERRFKVYGNVRLEQGMTSSFEDTLRKRVPEAVLLSIPSLAKLVETETQRLAKLPASERIAFLEGKAKSDPTNVAWPMALMREPSKGVDSKDTIKWATRVLELEPANPEALAVRASAYLRKKDYSRARLDFLALPRETQIKNTELLSAMFVAAVGSKDWDTADTLVSSLPPALRDDPAIASSIKRMESRSPKQPPAGAALAADASPTATTSGVPFATPAQRVENPPTAPQSAVPSVTSAASSTPARTPSEVPKRNYVKEAHALMAEGKNAEARDVLKSAIAAGVTDRDTRKLLLEASILARDWKSAAQQATVLEPFADGEGPFMFYAAVARYETGDLAAAAELMKRAKQKIVPGPFVDYYTKRILGSQ